MANNCHSPSVSFGIINSVINSFSAPSLVASKAMCQNLLKFFVDRIAYIRSHIIPPVTDPSTYVAFDHFMRIFLTAEWSSQPLETHEISSGYCSISPTEGCFDTVEVHTVSELSINKSSLQSRCVPAYFLNMLFRSLFLNSKPGSNSFTQLQTDFPFIYKVLRKLSFFSSRPFK